MNYYYTVFTTEPNTPEEQALNDGRMWRDFATKAEAIKYARQEKKRGCTHINIDQYDSDGDLTNLIIKL